LKGHGEFFGIVILSKAKDLRLYFAPLDNGRGFQHTAKRITDL